MIRRIVAVSFFLALMPLFLPLWLVYGLIWSLERIVFYVAAACLKVDDLCFVARDALGDLIEYLGREPRGIVKSILYGTDEDGA